MRHPVEVLKIEIEDKPRIDMLTNEEKGILLDAALKYHTGATLPEMPQAVSIVFSYISPKIDRDKQISVKRRQAVSKCRAKA